MQLLDKQALRSLLPDEDRLRFDDIPPHYLTDALDRVHGQADALAFPLTTEEVSALLRYAHDHDIPVTPRGAGTNLVGSTIPTKGGIVLDLSRMDRVLELDRDTMTITVEPGMLLQDLQAYVEERGLFYPPDPGEKAASIGGNISTNAGGMRAVKYGVTRDYVRGLTAVLADGTVLELGGKSANIYFDDCKWDMAIDGLQLGILFNQGQVCCAGSRVFVQEGIYDKFVEAAVKAFNNVNVGDPLDPNTQMGAQVDQGQLRKIMSYVNLAKEEGATIACGGEPYTDGACANGSFMKPTLIVNATNDMRVAQEEIFGPVAVVIKFKTEEEVIAMANDSVYGLGGAVWTRDINRAIRVARGVETGRMWVNTYNQIPSGAPFGGYKQSGIGRETHKVILEHYTQQKNIMINLNETPSGFYPEK